MPRPPQWPGHRGPEQHARAPAGSYPVPAGGSSADLAVGSCCRQLRSENVAEDALAHAAVRLLGADADEGVVVLAAAVAASAGDVRQILVVQTAQGLLRQLELLGLVHHRPPSHVGIELFPDSRSLPGPHKWAS